MKGAKPSVKKWTSFAGTLQRDGWNHFWDGIVGGAHLSDLRKKLDEVVFEHAYGARTDGTIVVSSPHATLLGR